MSLPETLASDPKKPAYIALLELLQLYERNGSQFNTASAISKDVKGIRAGITPWNDWNEYDVREQQLFAWSIVYVLIYVFSSLMSHTLSNFSIAIDEQL